ncbi:MAG TPA: FAD-dependent oxidoreductase, partial [Ilumatobacteraceae bacterium]|nr:FAD-dependent oxidoreductase [Ilumatobacteraceae bacterium]
RGNFRHSDDAVVPGFRAITDAVHAEGAAIVQQLYHIGQHGDFDNSYHASWSPSGLPSYHDAEGSHAMTVAEIEETIESFVDAAVRAQRSGFDGIELFAAYHALIDQFWLPWSNRRADEWGGSFENRMRFGHEVMSRIRSAVGDDFVIGVAVSIDPGGGGGAAMTIDELCDIVAWHDERRLMDYVTCGTGSYFSFNGIIPTFQMPARLGVPYAARLREVVRHARVQAESHIRTPEAAEQVLADGHADLVSIVRGQIADPYLVEKALQGRSDEIRTCISCNQQCWGRRSRDYWISCLVNPSVGREWEWGGDRFERVVLPREVLVVGGGPAGLEAARVAAERGHHVTLAEGTGHLGGAFRYAGLQPQRGQVTQLLEWYERELQRLDVRVLLDTHLDAAGVRATGADVVIVATGSRPSATGFQRRLPLQANLPGVDRADVFAVEEVMAGAQIGRRVVVLDDLGDWRGGGTAWHLADRGHEVTIVTPHAFVGSALQRTAGDGDLRATLARLGVRWHTEAALTSWSEDGADVLHLLDGSSEIVPADSLVLATTNTAVTDIVPGLDGYRGDVHVVGDAVAPRLAVHAIYDGRVAGIAI